MNRAKSFRSFPATTTIIGMNVAWYLAMESWRGSALSAFLRAGALDRETFHGLGMLRLLSSLFVHFSITHLLVNMVSVWSMAVVESLFGWAFFVTVYGLSGIIGNVMSLVLVPNGVFGGASGAVFGLFGVVLLLSLRGVFTKATRNQLLFWLGLNVVFDLTQPNIGVMAHLFGLVSGMLFVWGVAHKPKLIRSCRFLAWPIFGLGLLSLVILT